MRPGSSPGLLPTPSTLHPEAIMLNPIPALSNPFYPFMRCSTSGAGSDPRGGHFSYEGSYYHRRNKSCFKSRRRGWRFFSWPLGTVYTPHYR